MRKEMWKSKVKREKQKRRWKNIELMTWSVSICKSLMIICVSSMLICVQKESELRYKAKISFSRDMHTLTLVMVVKKIKFNHNNNNNQIDRRRRLAYKAKWKLEIWLKKTQHHKTELKYHVHCPRLSSMSKMMFVWPVSTSQSWFLAQVPIIDLHSSRFSETIHANQWIWIKETYTKNWNWNWNLIFKCKINGIYRNDETQTS